MSQNTEGVIPHGLLYTVVIDEYKHYEHLEKVRGAVGETIPALRRLGFAHQPVDLVGDGTWPMVSAALQEWSPPIDRPVMLYWTGHGRPVDVRGDLCLLYSDSPASLIKDTEQAMTATRLGGLIAQRRVKRAILLVDACNAGGGADEVISAFNRRRKLAGERDGSELRLAVITSAFGTQAASELAFSEALRTILTTDDSYFRPRDRWLTVDDIYSALQAALADSGQNPDIQTAGSIGAVFLNPWHIPNLPDVLVEAKTSAAAAIAATGAEHFLLKFRGIDVLTDQGWFFTGRQYTWERLR
ncbi:MAG TPA: hypothetical protein VFU65_17380, partial [Actinocrinis sp.]|nr:hypothetical protein [Actinocrinis sp.]